MSGRRSVLGLSLFPAPQPVEEDDYPGDQGDAAEDPERVCHHSSPVSRTAAPTIVSQLARPPKTARTDNGCGPTNWPSTSAPAARLASSRRVSTSAARCRLLNLASSSVPELFECERNAARNARSFSPLLFAGRNFCHLRLARCSDFALSLGNSGGQPPLRTRHEE